MCIILQRQVLWGSSREVHYISLYICTCPETSSSNHACVSSQVCANSSLFRRLHGNHQA